MSVEPLAEDSGSRGWRRFGRLARWLVPGALLALLLWRIPLEELLLHLGEGPVGWLALYVVVQVGVTLVADGVATRVALRLLGIERPLGTVLWVRGASYLLTVLNFLLGQGGIGIYLRRTGVPTAAAAGAALFVTAGSLATLLAVGVLAVFGWNVVAGAFSDEIAGLLPTVTALAVLGGFGAVVLARPPAILRRRSWLAPLFAVSLADHGRAFAARLPHTLLLLLGHWGALRLWGVPVPFGEGLALLAIVLLITALPIAPAGLGTFQAAQVWLLSGYVAGAAGEAKILSFSLVYHALGLVTQALFGAICLGPTLRAMAPSAAEGDG
ncbi:MAG: lysylphosphatidylglycerol synthase domain-containing protein [Acidobacteriota bacterium]